MTLTEFRTQIRNFFRLDSTKLPDGVLEGFFEEVKQSILFELIKSDNIKGLPITVNKQVGYTASNVGTTTDKILWLSDIAVAVIGSDKYLLNQAEETEIVMNLDEEIFPRRFNRISDDDISLDATITGTLQIECVLSPTSVDLVASLNSFDGQIMEMGRVVTSKYLNIYNKGGKK